MKTLDHAIQQAYREGDTAKMCRIVGHMRFVREMTYDECFKRFQIVTGMDLPDFDEMLRDNK